MSGPLTKPGSSLIAARIDLDGILVDGYSWLRISIRLPHWFGLRVARRRSVVAGRPRVERGLLVQPIDFVAVDDATPGGPPNGR